jgi:hypothetical protein
MRILLAFVVLGFSSSGSDSFAQNRVTPVKGDPFNEIDPAALKVDVPSLIHVHNGKDVARIRKELISFIWKNNGTLPTTSTIERVDTELPKPLANCPATCETLTISMDKGFKSVVYQVRPKAATKRLALFHQGHDGNVWSGGGAETVSFLIEKGFSVMVFQMPLFGDNKRFAPAGMMSHDDMAKLVSPDLEPIKYFVEPIVIALNNSSKKYASDEVVMIGLSGGGWTTTLYAAIDPRIRLSFPVAGTLPDYLRVGRPGDKGDWEQSYPALYANANYLDLYILGSSGAGRKQRQILNKFDSCCFSGVGYRTYEKHISKAVTKIGGGAFDVHLDETHRSHLVSASVLKNAIGPMLEK